MKNRLFALLIPLPFLVACASGQAPSVQAYRADGLPAWVGECFTNPQGLWAGYNTEKGYYASGEARFSDARAATTGAELDAKSRLLEFVSSDMTKGTVHHAQLFGVRRVDRFIAEDGTVYVLVFISQKDARKSLKK